MSDPLTLHEALQLEPISAGNPELLTPAARLDRPIRWVHIIGEDLPGNMLHGSELVLSTLPLLHEDREDLVPALHNYLADLDGVGAAALAIEVLLDRPKVREAIRQVAAEREARQNPELTPLLLFGRVVRFVEITEELHRQLISRQLGLPDPTASAWDPIVRATTNLFDDLASPGGLPQEEIADRAQALGISARAKFRPMVFRIYDNQGQRNPSDGRAPFLATLIRRCAAVLRFPVLVGSGGAGDIWVLLAHEDPQKLCTSIREEVVRRRNQEIVPRYTVALGAGPIALRETPRSLRATARIAASAAKLMELSPVGAVPTGVSRSGYWTAADLGLNGLLIHLIDNPHLTWFLEHHLAPFRGAEGKSMRDLVYASLSTGSNKAELARKLGISRPTLYARISRLERVLGRPLDGDTLTTAYTALLLEELKAPPPSNTSSTETSTST